MKENTSLWFCFLAISFATLNEIYSQENDEFASFFSSCHMNATNFDSCIRDALNDVRPYFKTGLPQYGVAPFDPFFANEVAHKGRFLNFNYKLLLKNVEESGWTVSQVTDLRTDFNKNTMKYTQFFPDKQLKGDYEFTGTIFGNTMNNAGTWNLSLYDFVQTTTLTRKPRRIESGSLVYDTPIKVDVNIQSTRDLKLHMSNLLRGRSTLENMLDQVINTAWQPGFVIFKPIINALVSTAFTDIFNKNFQNFPFENIIQY